MTADMEISNLDQGLPAIVSLIDEYVGRQALVLAVMKQDRPYWLARDRAEARRIMEMMGIPKSSGFWNADTDWRFTFHGLGCLLVNTRTAEPIEWDLTTDEDGRPLLNAFDKGWFLNWLEWRAQAPDRPIQGRSEQRLVGQMLKDRWRTRMFLRLTAHGVLQTCRQQPHVYELVFTSGCHVV